MKTEDWSDVSTRQGMPGVAGKPPNARKRQGRFQRERGPVDPLISDFQL